MCVTGCKCAILNLYCNLCFLSRSLSLICNVHSLAPTLVSLPSRLRLSGTSVGSAGYSLPCAAFFKQESHKETDKYAKDTNQQTTKPNQARGTCASGKLPPLPPPEAARWVGGLSLMLGYEGLRRGNKAQINGRRNIPHAQLGTAGEQTNMNPIQKQCFNSMVGRVPLVLAHEARKGTNMNPIENKPFLQNSMFGGLPLLFGCEGQERKQACISLKTQRFQNSIIAHDCF